MPRINEMVESKFLKKEDVDNDGRGALLTITGVQRYNVAKQEAEEDLKWCLDFQEVDKPMVLNITKMSMLEKITGSDNSDSWIGRKIVAYHDPSIMYMGEMKGGIGIRAPRTAVVNSPATPTAHPVASKLPAPPEDPIPF
jgi:hypothetical protein